MKKIQHTDKLIVFILLSLIVILFYIGVFFLLASNGRQGTIQVQKDDIKLEFSHTGFIDVYVKNIKGIERIVLLDEIVIQKAPIYCHSINSYALLRKEGTQFTPLISSSKVDHPELGSSLMLTIPTTVYHNYKLPINLKTQSHLILGVAGSSTLVHQREVGLNFIEMDFSNHDSISGEKDSFQWQYLKARDEVDSSEELMTSLKVQETTKIAQANPPITAELKRESPPNSMSTTNNYEQTTITVNQFTNKEEEINTDNEDEYYFDHYGENGYIVNINDDSSIAVRINPLVLYDSSLENLLESTAKVISKDNTVIATISLYERDNTLYGKIITLIEEDRPIEPYDIIVLERKPREVL